MSRPFTIRPLLPLLPLLLLLPPLLLSLISAAELWRDAGVLRPGRAAAPRPGELDMDEAGGGNGEKDGE
jgi:hypothetical protein